MSLPFCVAILDVPGENGESKTLIRMYWGGPLECCPVKDAEILEDQMLDKFAVLSNGKIWF